MRQQSISNKRVSPGEFAGVHIRFASVTSGIDEKFRFVFLQESGQNVEPGIIQFLSCKRHERQLAALKFTRERLTNVTGCAEEENHRVGFRRF